MKTREFFLLLLIIAAGTLLTHYETGEIENWRFRWEGDGWGPFLRTGKAFTFEEAGALPPPFSGALEVVNEHGSVEVRGGTEESLTVTLSKKVWRRNEEDARRAAESLGLILKDDGRTVIVAAGRPDAGLRNHETHFILAVPQGMKVTVRNAHGRVHVLRTGDTIISNSHGAVEAGEVGGSLTLENRHGTVSAADIAADCSIRNRHAGVRASRVKGNLKVEQAHSPVDAEDVSGEVTINATHSRVTGRRLSGSVKVDASFNTVSLTETGPALVRGRHTEIVLRAVRGGVDVSNSHGRTMVSEATGEVKIRGRNMPVRGEGLAASGIDILTSHGGVDLRNFSGRTTIRQKHAAVRLEPASIDGGILVEAEYAPLEFLWPAAARSPVECRARHGRVRWFLPQAPSQSTHNGVSLVRAFSDREGKPPVTLITSHADITVREGAGSARSED
ncbi:MAG: DUF4097 domain-containing protein [Candidatus Aminicenantes bacterium]|nr:DUF4097 domain-containing protein [Candidatus Aminicenantes bacterium]